MHERGLQDVNRDIAEAEAKLRALHAERRHIMQAHRDRVVAMFDAGMSIADISAELGLPYGSVQGTLWREGRTLSGRTAIKQRLRERATVADEASP